MGTGTATPHRRHDLPERIRALSGEGAFDLVAAARALASAGRDVIQLAIGEPDFATPAHIAEAGADALRRGETRYGPPEGIPELRAAIADTLQASGIPATASRVVVTPGAKSALAYAVLATVRPGDRVLVPDPGFPIYASLVRFAGGVPVPYPVATTGDPVPDEDALARLTPRVRAVIVNSPHNPTGTVAGRAALERLAAAAERHDLAVVSDEVYARLVHEPPARNGAPPERAPSIAAVPGLADRTIVVDGFSKTYAMTGWRLGYCVLPERLVRPVTLLSVNVHSCVAGFVQWAGVAALRGPQDIIGERRLALRLRRDVAVRALRDIPGVECASPAGAFYVFPRLGTALATLRLTAPGFCSLLLASQGVAVLPGTAFGERAADSIRIALTVPPDRLAAAAGRIRTVIELGTDERYARAGEPGRFAQGGVA